MNITKTYRPIKYKGRSILISYNRKGEYYRFCCHIIDPKTNKSSSFFRDFHYTPPRSECYAVCKLWARRIIDKFDSSK